MVVFIVVVVVLVVVLVLIAVVVVVVVVVVVIVVVAVVHNERCLLQLPLSTVIATCTHSSHVHSHSSHMHSNSDWFLHSQLSHALTSHVPQRSVYAGCLGAPVRGTCHRSAGV